MKTIDIDSELSEAAEELHRASHIKSEHKKVDAKIKKTERLILRRAKSEAVLLETLPKTIEMGTSIHVISQGDVDALSYLIYLSNKFPIEKLLISSWCMAMPDIQWIIDKINSGRLGSIDFVLGEIFPTQYPDEYIELSSISKSLDVTLKIARNHAKIIAGETLDKKTTFVIESSANINTNPRIEQTAIHFSHDLYDFYRDFFAGIKSIDRPTNKK